MAKVTHYPENGMDVVRGRARTLFVLPRDGKFDVFQFGHIDDSGIQKRRDWGSFDNHATAIIEAGDKADSLY